MKKSMLHYISPHRILALLIKNPNKVREYNKRNIGAFTV